MEMAVDGVEWPGKGLGWARFIGWEGRDKGAKEMMGFAEVRGTILWRQWCSSGWPAVVARYGGVESSRRACGGEKKGF